MSSDPPSGDPSPRPERDRAGAVAAVGGTLLEALERHLPGARRHADSTARLAFAAAEALRIGHERAELVRETARLHDLGMIYVPVEVLRKPRDELTADERAVLDGQIEAGARLALGAALPEEVCEWILHTRERRDGGGPAGLAGDQIPIESRIIRVACAADLMVAASEPEVTAAALRAAAERELDPWVVEHVTRILLRR